MKNILLHKLFEELTFFGGIAFYLIVCAIFLAINKMSEVLFLLSGLFLIYLLTFVIRLFYFKPRPDKQDYTSFLEKLDASSFPSIHAARIIFLALFLTFKIVTNLTITKILLMTILCILVIYSRIYLKKHHLSDILAGSLFGVLTYVILTYLL
jgi:undecaprenyl-diphosphatase